MLKLDHPISEYSGLGRSGSYSLVAFLDESCGAERPTALLVPPGQFRWLHATTEETKPYADGTQVTRDDLLGACANFSRPVLVDREHQSVRDPLEAKTEGWAHRLVPVEAGDELHLFLLAELEHEAAEDVDSGRWPYGSVVLSGKGPDAELLSHAITRYPVQSALLPSTAIRSTRELRVRALRTEMEETKAPETPKDGAVRSISPEDETSILAMLEAAGITGEQPIAEKLKLLIEKSIEQALSKAMTAEEAVRAKATTETSALRDALRKQSLLLAELEKRVGEHESERAERSLLDAIATRAKARKISLSDTQRDEVAKLARKVGEKSRDEVIDVSLRALNVPSPAAPEFAAAVKKGITEQGNREALITAEMTAIRSAHPGQPDFVLRRIATNRLERGGRIAPPEEN